MRKCVIVELRGARIAEWGALHTGSAYLFCNLRLFLFEIS